MKVARTRNIRIKLLAGLLAVGLCGEAMPQEGGGPLREAIQQGKALADEGRFAEAIPYQRRALELATRKFGAQDIKVSNLSMRLGVSLLKTGQPEEADPLFQQALEIREAINGPDHFSLVPPLLQLGRGDQRKAQFAAAESKCMRAVRILEKNDATTTPAAPDRDRIRLSRALRCLGNAYRMQGRYSEAEPSYKRSLSLLDENRKPELGDAANTIYGLGKLYNTQGRYEDAEKLLARVLTIREQTRGPDHVSVGMTLTELANTLQHQKRFAEAKTAAERGLKILKQHAGDKDDKRVAVASAKLGQIDVKLRNFPEAETLFTGALQSFERAQWRNHPLYVVTLTNLAKAYLLQDKTEEAEKALLRALDAGKEFRSDHTVMVRLYSHLAYLYRKQKRWDAALEYSRRGAGIMQQRLASYTSEWSTELDLNSQSGESEKKSARPMYIGFVNALERTKSGDDAAEAFEVGQLAHTTSAADALSSMAARFASGTDALAKIVRERQDMLAQKHALDIDLITSLGDSGDEATRSAITAKQQKLAEINQNLRQVGSKLAEEFPEYAELADPKPVPARELRNLIKPREALVVYLVGETFTFAWVVRDTTFSIFRLRIDRDTLAGMVTQLRAGLDPDKATRVSELPAFDVELAHTMYERIFAPLEEHLDGVQHVMVVPDGPLQSLPFSVLVSAPSAQAGTGQQQYSGVSWLTRKYAFSVLPSVSSLKALRRFARTAKSPQPFVGFGDPLLQGQPGGKRGITIKNSAQERDRFLKSLYELSPLPESADELRAIASSLRAGPKALYLGANATETAAKTMDLSQYRIIAFATHGLIAGQLQEITEPALVLTPPQKATPQDDGLLTMSEVAQLKLDADWVILSACNTASGDGKYGSEGLSGLARAFFYAGSRSLLVTHWPVISEAAVRLTAGTVTASGASGAQIGRAEALRRAMLDLINDPVKPYLAHPVFWAPFVVVGEGGVPQPTTDLVHRRGTADR